MSLVNIGKKQRKKAREARTAVTGGEVKGLKYAYKKKMH